MKLAVGLMAALVTGTVSAEPEPWMKKANPDELVLVLFGPNGECPGSKETLHETAKGVLTRSRIRVIEDAPTAEASAGTFPWLLVWIGCQGDLYDINVDFLVEDARAFRHRAGLFGYGSNGTHGNNAEHMANAVRRNVEAAITDYLKANFDL